MKRTLISALNNAVETTVRICGWVQTVRRQKKMQFLVIRDRTGLVQTVHERQTDDQLATTIDALTPESAVEVTGRVVRNDQAKLGGLEIAIDGLNIVNAAVTPLPLQDNATVESRMDWRFLDLRRPESLLVFQVQTTLEAAWREFWKQEGFLELHSPKLMGAASESGAELFKLADYFGREACLAQSPQFYKQMAIAAGWERVFEVGPVFRAELSLTTRHATEFTSIDVEIGWIDSHEDIMSWEERWLKFALEAVMCHHNQAIRKIFKMEITIPEIPFPRITMAEAHAILAEQGYQTSRPNGDLDPEGERRICQHVAKQYGHEFVFVTEYPIAVRPFYHMRPAGRPEVTNSFDLLWRGVEITTGAQREHRYDVLHAQAIEKGLDPSTIGWYMDMFRYGCPPHGGFGLGLARVVMLMLGLQSIRDTSFLFRSPNRLTP